MCNKLIIKDLSNLSNTNLITSGYKRCALCGEIKPVADFNKNGKGGYQSYCKECYTDYSRERRRNIKNGTLVPKQRKDNNADLTPIIISPQPTTLNERVERLYLAQQENVKATEEIWLAVDEMEQNHKEVIEQMQIIHQQEMEDMRIEYEKQLAEKDRECKEKIDRDRLVNKPDLNKLTEGEIRQVLEKATPRMLTDALYAKDASYQVFGVNPSTGLTYQIVREKPIIRA